MTYLNHAGAPSIGKSDPDKSQSGIRNKFIIA
jgi:hypothetical protein